MAGTSNQKTDFSAGTEFQPSGQWTPLKELVVLILILAAAMAARWPFRHVVLVRDEGEYVYLAQQILQGATPYLDVYNQKTPFVFYLMSFFQLLVGRDLVALHMATAVYGLLSTVVLYLFTRRLFGQIAAIGAALAFNVMTFDQCGVAHSASTEFFMLLWITVAIDLWYRGSTSGRWWLTLLSGMAAGMAYQTKQTGMAVIAFLVIERVWARIRSGPPDCWSKTVKDIALSTGGFIVVLCAVMLFFASRGALAQYIECTWTNNWQYVGRRQEGPGRIFKLAWIAIMIVARWDVGLWLWGSIGLIVHACKRGSGRGNGLWILLALFAAAALAAGSPFVHYYEPLIVPLAIGTGITLSILCTRLACATRLSATLLYAMLLLIPWIWPAIHWISYPLMTASEWTSLNKVLPHMGIAPRIGKYMAEQTTPDESFLVIGSEPEIYYYANRRACTRLVFTFPVIGPYSYSPRLQEEFRRDFDNRNHRYVVVMSAFLTEWPEHQAGFLTPYVKILQEKYELERTFFHEGRDIAWVFRRKEK